MKKYVIEYDPQADAAYIKLGNGKVADTVEINKDMFVDTDSHKHVIGLEILNFSKRKLNLAQLLAKPFGNLLAIAK